MHGGMVLDASTALAWVLPGQQTLASEAWLDATATHTVWVCLHWHIEVANIFSLYQRRGQLTQEQVACGYEQLAALNVYSDSETIERLRDTTFPLALRHTLTIYDAAYLELAHRLGAPLATLDKKLIAAAAAEGIETTL